ncbi:lipoprotein [Lacisediminimonas sp.]|uniref:LPS translocon maturation chaperone LptM n=1 Tax=Lacisediminimonas sp. TaxID=3060582 RepID=UPI00351D428B
MKHLVLPLHAALAGVFFFLISGCGQTGPLYLPKPEQGAPAGTLSAPTGPTTSPASSLVSPQGDAQLPQPTPTTTIPRPGTR